MAARAAVFAPVKVRLAQRSGHRARRLGVRTCRATDRDLAAGNYDPAADRDLHALAGGLAEVSGWLLYNADRQDEARRMSQEALLAARLAGDRSMELFVLGNLSMQAIHLRRGREALNIADAVLNSGRLPRRVAAMFHARRGRALSLLGDQSAAVAELELARSMAAEGIRSDDPPWTWWIEDAELLSYRGIAAQSAGEPGLAADLLGEAVELVSPTRRRGRYSYLMFQLGALVDAQAWSDAERVALELAPYVGEVGSARMATLLRDITGQVDRDPHATAGLRDVLHMLVTRLS